jgi:hypothetical protein
MYKVLEFLSLRKTKVNKILITCLIDNFITIDSYKTLRSLKRFHNHQSLWDFLPEKFRNFVLFFIKKPKNHIIQFNYSI